SPRNTQPSTPGTNKPGRSKTARDTRLAVMTSRRGAMVPRIVTAKESPPPAVMGRCISLRAPTYTRSTRSCEVGVVARSRSQLKSAGGRTRSLRGNQRPAPGPLEPEGSDAVIRVALIRQENLKDRAFLAPRLQSPPRSGRRKRLVQLLRRPEAAYV